MEEWQLYLGVASLLVSSGITGAFIRLQLKVAKLETRVERVDKDHEAFQEDQQRQWDHIKQMNERFVSSFSEMREQLSNMNVNIAKLNANTEILIRKVIDDRK
ncbi:MAG: hypothetical protein KI786_05725 [Mameliella sp.]|nr:hypothetical protein [Phaeodactylibacter sp.]